MTQDKRTAIFEAGACHIASGLRHLARITKRLHRSCDFDEDFEFLAWFEYASHYGAALEELVRSLRVAPEWRFADREVDSRFSLLRA
jgi:hypothetical protein